MFRHTEALIAVGQAENAGAKIGEAGIEFGGEEGVKFEGVVKKFGWILTEGFF